VARIRSASSAGATDLIARAPNTVAHSATARYASGSRGSVVSAARVAPVEPDALDTASSVAAEMPVPGVDAQLSFAVAAAAESAAAEPVEPEPVAVVVFSEPCQAVAAATAAEPAVVVPETAAVAVAEQPSVAAVAAGLVVVEPETADVPAGGQLSVAAVAAAEPVAVELGSAAAPVSWQPCLAAELVAAVAAEPASVVSSQTSAAGSDPVAARLRERYSQPGTLRQ